MTTEHDLGPLPEPDIQEPVYQDGFEVGLIRGYSSGAARAYALSEVQRAVERERERCNGLARLAVDYAKDADWSRVDAVLGLISRPA